MSRDSERLSLRSSSLERAPDGQPTTGRKGLQTLTSPKSQYASGSPEVGPRLRMLVPRLVVAFVLPIVVYFALRPHVDNDAIALAIGGAIPAAWTLAGLAWNRRIDPLGVIAVVGFGVEFLVTVLSGGTPLALKLQEAPLTGAFGLVCLVSVAVRRPLLPAIFHFFGRRSEMTTHRATTATAVIGATCLIDAATRVALAVMLPTSTFVALSREVSWVILGGGLALLWWISRTGSR